jgi:hypothetical protein
VRGKGVRSERERREDQASSFARWKVRVVKVRGATAGKSLVRIKYIDRRQKIEGMSEDDEWLIRWSAALPTRALLSRTAGDSSPESSWPVP